MDTPIEISSRPRRNRKSAAIRALCSETTLQVEQLVYPVFIHAADKSEDIAAMPGCKRWCVPELLEEINRAISAGIKSVVLFPKIDEGLKTSGCEEAYNESGLVPEAIKQIKKEFPELVVITDVALDPYSSDGHDGLVATDGTVLNDETLEVLCRQALAHAEAGADIVSPSDMMDGRVGAIRHALDEAGNAEVSILAYTAKYASALYGPFRGALDSAPRAGSNIPGDKKTYQMDPANHREALRELMLDEAEGADMVMVKPASYYLDIIRLFKEQTVLPVAAYQVSGEYLMIKAAASSGWLDERQVALESLLSIKRAGADIIFSYFAPEVAGWLRN